MQPHPSSIPPLRYADQYQALPHTEERLGILEPGGQQVVLSANVHSSGGKSHPVFQSASFGAGLEVLETIPVASPEGGDGLDQNTTISRSFRSAVKRPSSSSGKFLRDSKGRHNLIASPVTLNERFGIVNNQLLGPEEGVTTNISDNISIASAQSKLSQVRILTSPPPNDPGGPNQVMTRTPSNAMRSTRKSLLSGKSVKSFLGSKSKCNMKRTPNVTLGDINSGAAKTKMITHVATSDKKSKVARSDSNMETDDNDEVFLGQGQRTDQLLSQQKNVTPINTELAPRHLSHELWPSNKVITSGGSYWTNPRKERQVGSPGNTANMDYFINKQTPQVVEINLHKSGVQEARTDIVRRQDKLSCRRKVIKSAPASQAIERHGGVGRDVRLRAPDHTHHLQLHKAYNPGYSESDLTSQSEDEIRRQNWDRRGALEPELPSPPGLGPHSGLGFDLTPPVLDLSQVVSSTLGVAPPSAPLITTSALSTGPLPLQYSSVSFSPSDISLIVSPLPGAADYASSQSSHPVSLDWDNYASDPQFQDNFLGKP